MLDTGIIPACAEDLKYYSDTTMGGNRADLYGNMVKANDALRTKIDGVPGEAGDAAKYMISDLIPAMNEVRGFADQAERKCRRELWPYPTYAEIVYTHHTE